MPPWASLILRCRGRLLDSRPGSLPSYHPRRLLGGSFCRSRRPSPSGYRDRVDVESRDGSGGFHVKQGSASSEQVFSLRNLIPGTCDCRVVPLMLCLRRSTSIGIPLPALNVSRETGYRGDWLVSPRKRPRCTPWPCVRRWVVVTLLTQELGRNVGRPRVFREKSKP